MADKILSTGLDALLGDVAAPNKQSIKEIELNQIKPNRFQPRQSFDEQKINELSKSIAKHGILSPILVRETGAGGYELIAGERRLRAAQQAGLTKAPCMVDSAEDQLSLDVYNVAFYAPKDIYLDQLNLIDNRLIYANKSLATYIQNDKMEIKARKLMEINSRKQQLLIELEVLKNG